MKKVKILNIIHSFAYGGTETFLYNYLSNLDNHKFDITLMAIKDYSDKLAINKFTNIGCKVILVDNWEKYPLKTGIKILKILRKNKFDIIHSHLSHTNFYFMILGKIEKVKIRISHSHLIYVDKTIKEKIKHSIYKKLILLFSTHYMACSEAAAYDLYGTTKNVCILKNAIDLKKYEFDSKIRDKYRKIFDIKNNEKLLCNIGRMCEQKNQLFLIDIFKCILDRDSSFKLLIIGDGELKENIINKIEQYNIKDKVLILSKRDDVNDILQAVDIFILPSLYEGLGIVLIESQASGIPCFASNNVVPEEAKVSNLLKFIELKDNPEKWANEIINTKIDVRTNHYMEISNKGYNIEIEAKKLEEYYKKQL